MSDLKTRLESFAEAGARDIDLAPPNQPRRRAHPLVPAVGAALVIALVALVVGVIATRGSSKPAVQSSQHIDRIFIVSSEAMVPALEKNDRVGATTHFQTIERGAIVVFQPPKGTDPSLTYLIKRVVGLPGDTVAEHDGKLYVNGKPLAEPYLPAGTVTDCACFPSAPLGPNQYFVLGDNRPSSKDSRFFGPIDRNAIMGVVVRIMNRPET